MSARSGEEKQNRTSNDETRMTNDESNSLNDETLHLQPRNILPKIRFNSFQIKLAVGL